MNNTLIFLRHGQTKIDPNILISQWHLTEAGVKNAEGIARDSIFDTVDIIITSAEPKAIETALPIAQRLGKKILQVKGLGELNRDKGGTMDKEKYEDMERRIFEDLNYTAHGWETARHALERYTQAVEKIEKKHENKTILIVSHANVMSLYFSYILSELNPGLLIGRRKRLQFCGYGVMRNRRVTKDI